MSPPSCSPLSSPLCFKLLFGQTTGIVFIREWTIVLRLERSREWSFVKGVCFDQVRECCSLVSVLYSPLCCCWRGHESCCCCLVVLMLL
ncbi:hypothetical protein Bca4012_091625 [Brassica carinata]